MKQTLHLKQKALVTAIALAFASTYAADIFAQALESHDTKEKEETPAMTVVTVSAQGRRENILKVPYNISSINGDQLSDRNIVDQTEMLRGVAGASVVDRGARNSGVLSGVTIRGMNVNGSALGDFQASAVPTVSTYVNSTPMFANFLIKDVERVEVLRGPQGTLYGSGSLGGTVRYITRRPELNTFSGKLDGTYSKTDGSSGSNYSADGIFNFPITDTIAARVVIGKVDNAGVIDYRNVYKLDAKGEPVAPNGKLDPAASYKNVKDADTVDQKYARVSVLAKPNASFQALLTYQTQTDDVGGRRQPTRGNDGFGVPYGKYENGSVQLEPSSREVSLTALEMDFDLGFATLSSATSHYDQTGKSLSENTGFYAMNAWLANYYYNYPRPMAKAERHYGDRAFVQEIRLVSRKGSSFDYIVGAYLQNQTLDASQMSYLVGLKSWADLAMPGNSVTSDNDFLFQRTQKFKERALFGELTWHLAPTLRLTGGMRAFKTNFSNDSVLGSGVTAPSNTPINTINSQKDSGTLFKANMSWDLAPQKMLYATVSQGYRRAGANAVPLTGTFAESPAWQTFKPDTNTNFEIGIKGVEGDLRYNVSLFDIRWKDIQIDTTTPLWGFYVAQNGGKAESKGLELELSGRLTTDLRFGLNYGFVDAKLSEDVLRADRPSVVSAKAGTVLPGTAKHTVSANLDHVTLLSNDWYWTNRISAYYQSATQNSISQSPRETATWSGFSQFGLSSTLAADKWSATFFVKNLTNNAGVTGGFLESSMGTAPAQNYYGNGSKVLISQPRTIGLSASYRF